MTRKFSGIIQLSMGSFCDSSWNQPAMLSNVNKWSPHFPSLANIEANDFAGLCTKKESLIPIKHGEQHKNSVFTLIAG